MIKFFIPALIIYGMASCGEAASINSSRYYYDESDASMESNSFQEDSLIKKYYSTWTSYQLPRKPVGELPADSVKNMKAAYYNAYYNKNKQLVIFEKMLDNSIVWRDEYFYWEGKNKLQKCIQTDSSGKKTEKLYDKKGKEQNNS